MIKNTKLSIIVDVSEYFVTISSIYDIHKGVFPTSVTNKIKSLICSNTVITIRDKPT